MKNVLLVVALVGIVGCDDSVSEKNKSDRQLVNYHCNDEQMASMEKAYAICNDSSYISSFCFKQAKMGQCSYIGVNEKAEIKR